MTTVHIDEHGQLFEGLTKIKNSESCLEILENLKINEGRGLESLWDQEKITVTCFDHPLVIERAEVAGRHILLSTIHGGQWVCKLDQLFLDEWDRFMGYTDQQIPWVLSRKAQDQFFSLLDEYDDDSVTFQGGQYAVLPFWEEQPHVEGVEHWDPSYEPNVKARWDLGEPNRALVDMLPKLKLAKSRVLVLGCGEGHDAAFFAEGGHAVTAVDISEAAIARAQQHYQHKNIRWIVGDLFELTAVQEEKFDIIFEHTCYCAINPTRRNELVKIWNRCLSEGGHLMATFFTFCSRQGPPFGTTEWEVRQRLQKTFEPLFWGRWENSIPGRQGKETFVYARRIQSRHS